MQQATRLQKKKEGVLLAEVDREGSSEKVKWTVLKNENKY